MTDTVNVAMRVSVTTSDGAQIADDTMRRIREAIDAIVRTQVRVHARKDFPHTRMAIEIGDDSVESIDIIDPLGNLLMRLNIYNHASGNASIDVIGNPARPTLNTVQAWANGERLFRESREAGLTSVIVYK